MPVTNISHLSCARIENRPPVGLIAFALFAFLVTKVSAIDLDPTFATGGKFMTTFGSAGNPSSAGREVFVQPSGRIVVVASHSQQGGDGRHDGIGLVGLTAYGSFDNTFGIAGKVLVWGGSTAYAIAGTAMLADGSILVLAQYREVLSTNKPVLIKFAANGATDSSFAPDLDVVHNDTYAVNLALGEGGKIYALVARGINDDHHLIRLNADGSRDTSFAPNGVRPLNVRRIRSRDISGMHELANGKIVLTGSFDSDSFGGTDMFAARYNADGNLDRTFGLQGVVKIAVPYGYLQMQRSLVLADGSVVVAGAYTFLGSYAVMVKITKRGRLDTSFGSGGISFSSFDNVNVIYDLAPTPDGKIYAVGECGAKALPPNRKQFLARYSPTGSRESFILTNFIGSRDAGGVGLALQADGKIVTAGFTLNASDNFAQAATARYTP